MAALQRLIHSFIPCALAAALMAALPAGAQSSCSSDGVPRPVAVLERFINADCDTCWQDKATPAADKGALALDWVLPGGKGEDAALSAVALPESLDRLASLGRKPPLVSDAQRTRIAAGKPPQLRIAQGMAFNDYIAASIELGPARSAWSAWLLLVEQLPAGTEGSPVARNLVRNVFRPDWDASSGDKRSELRAMQIREGAQPSRLRVVALLHDAKGRLVAAVQSRCR